MKFPMQSSSFRRDLVKDLCGLMQQEDGQGTRARSSDKQRKAPKKGDFVSFAPFDKPCTSLPAGETLGPGFATVFYFPRGEIG
jgi:hypothetical protein